MAVVAFNASTVAAWPEISTPLTANAINGHDPVLVSSFSYPSKLQLNVIVVFAS
jgi:hypothetical protein